MTLRSASNSRAANAHRRGLAAVVAAVSCAVVIAACGSSGPSQRVSGGTAKGELVAASLDYSKCMRQHGVPGFPDPTLTPPPNPANHSAAIGRNRVVVTIPRSMGTSSPPFKQAATACRLPPRQVTHLAPFGLPASLSPPEKREVEDEEDAETDD
jgi:hypothetical protein